MGQSTGIRLDATRAPAMYRQLFDQIVGRIRGGAWPAGHRLPPTRLLANELGAHRNTVVRAYRDLERAGFIHSTVGRGTFVAAIDPETPPSGAAAPPRMQWDAVLSRAVGVEPLGRAERNAAIPVPPDAIHLARMQPSPDLLPHDLLRRCIEHVLATQGPKALGYAPRDGLPRLRGLIAEDLRSHGLPARAEDILITTGSQQALDLIARAFVNPGDTFLVEETTYTGAINILSAAGARLVGVPSDGEGPEPDALAQFTRTGAKGFYLMPNCNNPTGTCLSAARRERIVAWSRQAGVPIIEDDYAANLVHTDAALPPALRSLDGDVIHMGTFSKKLIPALRIGFVLCPPDLRARLLGLKHALDLGTSLLLQHALAEFLERGYLRAHLRRTLPEYRRRRDALDTALRERLPARVAFRAPDAGVVLWLPLAPPYSAESIRAEAHRRGVVVSPGSLNRVDGRPREGIRLTFCAEPVDRLVEAARRLGQAFQTVEKQGRVRREEGAQLGVV